MEEVVAKAKENRGMYAKKTILFIDEIHRFNKGQQDYLLPFVEDGTIILIGATTENPYFEVNGALISGPSFLNCIHSPKKYQGTFDAGGYGCEKKDLAVIMPRWMKRRFLFWLRSAAEMPAWR